MTCEMNRGVEGIRGRGVGGPDTFTWIPLGWNSLFVQVKHFWPLLS